MADGLWKSLEAAVKALSLTMQHPPFTIRHLPCPKKTPPCRLGHWSSEPCFTRWVLYRWGKQAMKLAAATRCRAPNGINHVGSEEIGPVTHKAGYLRPEAAASGKIKYLLTKNSDRGSIPHKPDVFKLRRAAAGDEPARHPDPHPPRPGQRQRSQTAARTGQHQHFNPGHQHGTCLLCKFFAVTSRPRQPSRISTFNSRFTASLTPA